MKCVSFWAGWATIHVLKWTGNKEESLLDSDPYA